MSLPVNAALLSHSASRKRAWTASLIPLLALYAVLLILTRPTYIGDTFWYAQDIDGALGKGWSHSPQIWNFAHLLLRPAGLLLSRLFLGVVAPWFGGARQVGITFLLVLVSIAATLACAVLIRKMTLAVTRNHAAAFISAAAFLCLSVVLNYSRSGASYLPGLAAGLMALYRAGFSPSGSRAAAIWSGFFAGLSVLFWLPFIVLFPAILLAGPILDPRPAGRRSYVLWGVWFLAGAGVTMAAAFGIAAASLHITGWTGLVAWIRSSDSQFRDRKLLRMVTGFARSFYELGNDAVYLKWFLFKDPYAKVGFLELLRVSFAKLALFYASLAGLAILLWISRAGRALLLLAAVALLPQIGMALMFESGSPERYLPALPLVFVGFGYAIANPAFHMRTRIAAAALCCAHVPVNLVALSAPVVNASIENDAARISALASLNPASRVYVINGFDGLFVLQAGHPFHILNRGTLPQIGPIVPLGPRVPFWRSDFACQVLSTWDRGGEVWVTRRILADAPARDWLWVEGDDRRLGWTAMHGFFSTLELGPEKGGSDGFFLEPQNAANRATMLRNCSAAAAQ